MAVAPLTVGQFALLRASARGSVDVAAALIDAKVQVDVEHARQGVTALQLAARSGHIEMVVPQRLNTSAHAHTHKKSRLLSADVHMSKQ